MLGVAALRIVSLAPSLTEDLFAIGAGPRVIAIDEYSNPPAAAARRPRIGALRDANAEKILAQARSHRRCVVSSAGARRPRARRFARRYTRRPWVGTVGALLDASTLIITTLDIDKIGPATMLNRLGRHLVDDFTHFYDLDQPMAAGVERSELVAVYERLRALGSPLHPEDEAWQRFSALRATYAGPVNAIAQYLRIPPAQWVGDCSSIANRHMPAKPVALNVETR